MIIKPVLFSVKNDVKIKQLKDFFKSNRNKNCIIKFENNDNPDEDFINEAIDIKISDETFNFERL